ncbi:visual pigment-like receptor peropsin [Branchiostoma lanceolatum]|uniref:visual pigment-like receptor peropsin n=1 Tax=Branchiostoma lanceolatum TaxID=7740 RepID=UPI00345651B6
MSASPSAWLSSGELVTDSPENTSEWPWTDGPTQETCSDDDDHFGYESYLAVAIYLTLLGLMAIGGNSIAIITFVRKKEFRNKEHNSLLLNMAIADLGVSIFAYPSTTVSGYAGKWMLGDVGCTIFGFLCFTFSLVTEGTLCAISVYRFIVICKPQHAYLLTHRRTMYVILGTWVYALLFTIPPLVGVSYYTYEPIRLICSLNWKLQYPGEIAYTALTIVFCYIANVWIMGYCYFKIFSKSTNLKFGALASEKAKKAVKSDILKAARMCLAMVVSYLFVWTPYAVSSTWNVFVDGDLPVLATVLPSLFAKTSCMLNPIIYTCCNSKFRQAVSKSLRRRGCLNKQVNPLDTAQMVRRKRRSDVELAAEGMAMKAVPPSKATGDGQSSSC